MAYEFGNNKAVLGVVWGVVSDNKHPDGKYMVRAKLPWILSKDAKDDADFLTTWARVMTPMAGSKRGFYNLPEVGDEVVISFIHGNINNPVVLGAVWNDKDKAPHGGEGPPETTDPMGNTAGLKDAGTDTKDGKNHARYLMSRGGSFLLFDDTPGKEKIVLHTAGGSVLKINDEKKVISIYDAKKETYLHMDADKKKITLECKNGDIDIFCKKGLFNLEAKNITTKADQDVTHAATNGKWKQTSKGTMNMEATGAMTAKGSKIDLNP